MQLYHQIVQLDFFLAVTVLFLGIFLRINRSSEKELNSRIKLSLAFILTLAVAENIEVRCAGLPACTGWYKFGVLMEDLLWVPCLLFAVRVIRTRPLTKQEKIWLYAPAAINTVLILPAFFSDYVVRVDEAGVLHDTLLHYFPVIMGMNYFIFVMLMVRDMRMRGFREEANILTLGDVAVLAGAVSELTLQAHGIMASAITLTLTFYYLYLHMDHSKRDMLTGALTRACFFSDLSKLRPDQLSAFCEFDMNNLKLINDQQGHQAGDDAIVFMYRLIISCLPTNARLYRFGGDEFVVLFYSVNMSTVYGTIYKIREQFDDSEYSCAIGIAEWTEGSTFEEVYNRADQDMYEDKKKQKAIARGEKPEEA